MGGWKGIESAPTFIGTQVLLLGVNGGVYVGQRVRYHDQRWVSVPGRYAIKSPTHWMPLPSPPAQTEDSK